MNPLKRELSHLLGHLSGSVHSADSTVFGDSVGKSSTPVDPCLGSTSGKGSGRSIVILIMCSYHDELSQSLVG